MKIEIIKIIISFLTPFLVFIFGIIFLRKTEKIKQEIVRRSNFAAKWSEEFFTVYKQFISDIEDIMSCLTQVQSEKNEVRIQFYEKKLHEAALSTIKSELHISTMLSSFPEIKSESFKKHMDSIIEALSEILKTKKGNLDPIKSDLSYFSKEARGIHSNLLKL
jgi:hypothetical protein